MAFVGAGFYAMWNGMDPAHMPEFELMHARNHMPAHVGYLGDGGILAARRHGSGVGALPPFFTFYDMRSLDVLTDPVFAHRRVVESEWFLQLRPHYRDHIRHHCRVQGRAGGGIGGAAGTLLMRLRAAVPADAAAAEALCAELVSRASITAAHFGVADPHVPTLVGGAPPPRNVDDEPVGVLVVEGYERHVLAADLPSIARRMVGLGIAAAPPRFAHYALSLAVDYAELPLLRLLDAAPR